MTALTESEGPGPWGATGRGGLEGPKEWVRRAPKIKTKRREKRKKKRNKAHKAKDASSCQWNDCMMT